MIENGTVAVQMTMPSWAILKLLAEGQDPVTGLDHNIPVLHATAVRQALSDAVNALIAANAPAPDASKADAKAVKQRKVRKPREPKAFKTAAATSTVPAGASATPPVINGATPPEAKEKPVGGLESSNFGSSANGAADTSSSLDF